MTNVVHHNFNYKAPEGFTPIDRYDLGPIALLLSVRSQISMAYATATASLHEGVVGVTNIFPLLELCSSIYGDLTLPFKLTSDHGVRTQNSNPDNYSVIFTHFPLSMMKDMSEMLDKGIVPQPTLQVEVSYIEYEEGKDEETLFKNTHVPSYECASLDPCLNNDTISYIHANLARVVQIHGGFMGKGRSDDNTRACLIGMIPMLGRAYVRLAVVFDGEVKDVK